MFRIGSTEVSLGFDKTAHVTITPRTKDVIQRPRTAPPHPRTITSDRASDLKWRTHCTVNYYKCRQ